MGKDITVKATGTKAGYANGLSVSNAIAAALNPRADGDHADRPDRHRGGRLGR